MGRATPTPRPSKVPSLRYSSRTRFRTGECSAAQSIFLCPSGARAGSLTIDCMLLLRLCLGPFYRSASRVSSVSCSTTMRMTPPDHLLPLDLEVLRAEGHLEGDVGGEELGLEILEDETNLVGELADPALPGGAPFDPHLSLHPAPKEVRDQAIERDAQCALPRPGRPHDDHELPLGHLQVHPV